jgi:hypothetical protein
MTILKKNRGNIMLHWSESGKEEDVEKRNIEVWKLEMRNRLQKLTSQPMKEYSSEEISFLPLGATAQNELWPPEQSASILLYSSSILPILSLSFSEDHHAHPPTIPNFSTRVFLSSLSSEEIY